MEKEVVLITGANSGIGLAMASALLADGFPVVGLDLEIGRLETLRRDYPDRLLALECDLTDDAGVQAAVEAVRARFGRIDILVNNACAISFSPFEEKPLALVRHELEVNFFGAVRMIRAVLPGMKAGGRGLVHTLSSGVGLTGYPGIFAYTASKGALESMVRTLALEYAGSGVAFTIMHPPLTDTQSASPLGVPREAMDSPERVGRNLARQIRSTRPVIAADFRTALYLLTARLFPSAVGRLFAALGSRGKADQPGPS